MKKAYKLQDIIWLSCRYNYLLSSKFHKNALRIEDIISPIPGHLFLNYCVT